MIEEAREREEDGHAEVPAWHPPVPEMEQQDQSDRERAYAVQRGLVGECPVLSGMRGIVGDPPQAQAGPPASVPQVTERFAVLGVGRKLRAKKIHPSRPSASELA